MMSLKANLTCGHCLKIFKEPYVLPCGHTTCKQHLQEAKIKCTPCYREFSFKNECDFVPNYVVSQIIDDENYLYEYEQEYKTNILESMNALQQINNEFKFVKKSFHAFDLEFHEHFQEVRRQIDLHRENEYFNSNNKSKIDETALAMIKQTKEFEGSYYKSLNEIVQELIKYQIDDTSIEQKLTHLNEMFREPVVEIEKIEQIQSKQGTQLNELKSRLQKLNELREQLKSNQFVPNESLNEFGTLILNEHKSLSSNSLILSRTQSIDLIEICQFSLNDKWTLLYRESGDEFSGKEFHSKCDGHSNTLTIVKVANDDDDDETFIFGGYTTACWSSDNCWKYDANAFLFSLINKENRPCKMNVTKCYKAIYCHAIHGPIFGDGDLRLSDCVNLNEESFSDLGFTYEHLEYIYGSSKAQTFLAGSHKFQINEIEVYRKN